MEMFGQKLCDVEKGFGNPNESRPCAVCFIGPCKKSNLKRSRLYDEFERKFQQHVENETVKKSGKPFQTGQNETSCDNAKVSAWLIELSEPGSNQWWSGIVRNGIHTLDWSIDRDDAIRFSREQDARNMIASKEWRELAMKKINKFTFDRISPARHDFDFSSER